MKEENEKNIPVPYELIPFKKSRNRKAIESALERAGISLEMRISVVNLDSDERYYFDDYHQAIEFMKGKKGKWYVTTPGIRYNKDSPAESR
jgi:cellulose synthase/poly-beta-1,6-N-acetylglucosamine synthase-like glycosyltransferase